MVYDEYKVYGPYLRKDGRKHVCLIHNITGKRKTISYPKYLVEISMGKLLGCDETIDHIDCNKTNDELSNLRILNRKIHGSLDAMRLVPVEILCQTCNIKFILDGKKLHDAYTNKKLGCKGPFCSKSCGSRANKKMYLYTNVLIGEPEYYSMK